MDIKNNSKLNDINLKLLLEIKLLNKELKAVKEINRSYSIMKKKVNF